MQIFIEPTHLMQPHHDSALSEWTGTIKRPVGHFDTAGKVFPSVSGRALRSLLLNAAASEPILATPTFELVAKQYTPSKLFAVYHALILDEESAWNELRRESAPQFVNFRNRRIPLDALLALTYLLVAISYIWKLTPEQETAVQFLLGRCAEGIDRAVSTLSHLESVQDPLRSIYTRSYSDGSRPDETVAVVDAKVYAAYLAAGYTDAQLIARIEAGANNNIFVRQV